jgi:hypothetical protein
LIGGVFKETNSCSSEKGDHLCADYSMPLAQNPSVFGVLRAIHFFILSVKNNL